MKVKIGDIVETYADFFDSVRKVKVTEKRIMRVEHISSELVCGSVSDGNISVQPTQIVKIL